jgi:hypothetical protein
MYQVQIISSSDTYTRTFETLDEAENFISTLSKTSEKDFQSEITELSENEIYLLTNESPEIGEDLMFEENEDEKYDIGWAVPDFDDE